MALSNRTRTFDPEGTLHGIFDVAAHAQPSAIALLVNRERSERGGECTYGELRTRAGSLAVSITALGVLCGQEVIALLFERSLEMLVAIFGALLSGAGYLPLEPSSPPLQITSILEEARCPLLMLHAGMDLVPALLEALRLLTRKRGSQSNDPPSLAAIAVDEHGAISADPRLGSTRASASPRSGTEDVTALSACPSDIAYILYTSGSTGRPKGVMVEHRHVVARVQWFQRTMSLSVGDQIPWKTPYVFGISEWEVMQHHLHRSNPCAAMSQLERGLCPPRLSLRTLCPAGRLTAPRRAPRRMILAHMRCALCVACCLCGR